MYILFIQTYYIQAYKR